MDSPLVTTDDLHRWLRQSRRGIQDEQVTSFIKSLFPSSPHPTREFYATVEAALEEMDMLVPAHSRLIRERFLNQKPMAELAYEESRSEAFLFKAQRAALEFLATTLQSHLEAKYRKIDNKLASQIPFVAPNVIVGRESTVQQMINFLESSERFPILGITGLGGIGKTTLAYLLVKNLLRRQSFIGVLWYSVHAQVSSLAASQRDSSDVIDDIFRTLYRQLGFNLDSKLPNYEMFQELHGFLVENPYIIVVDNLETAVNSNVVVAKLRPLLNGKTKLIFTSRHQTIDPDVYSLVLSPLTTEESLLLLKTELHERGIPNEAESDFHKLAQMIGGHPLSLKLAAALLTYLPLESIVQSLVSPNEGVGLYENVFEHTWKMLPQVQQEILTFMAINEKASYNAEDIAQALGTSSEKTETALRNLTVMNLLEIPRSTSHRRFSLHTIIKYLVLHITNSY
jgi:DNA polymerase III delta prime subunit